MPEPSGTEDGGSKRLLAEAAGSWEGSELSAPQASLDKYRLVSGSKKKIKQIVRASPAPPHSGNGQLQGEKGNLLSRVARCSFLTPPYALLPQQEVTLSAVLALAFFLDAPLEGMRLVGSGLPNASSLPAPSSLNTSGFCSPCGSHRPHPPCVICSVLV
jgi:hypothetical protein